MDFLMAAFDRSQEGVDGTVSLALYKGNVTVTGRASPASLYNQDLASMEVEGGFNALDSKGFININAIRLKARAHSPRGRAAGAGVRATAHSGPVENGNGNGAEHSPPVAAAVLAQAGGREAR
jgi:hypothetical protein